MSFKPMLIKTEIPFNQAAGGEHFWVVCHFQNIGDDTAPEDFEIFADLEFGHQRILEDKTDFYRLKTSPYPGMTQWKKGDIIATTFRWKILVDWCGTYRVNIGISDKDGNITNLIGANGKEVSRQYAGDLEVAWGWGKPLMYETRVPVNMSFNEPIPCITTSNEVGTVEIKDEISVSLHNSIPIITKMQDDNSCFNIPFYNPETTVRDLQTGDVLTSTQSCVQTEYKLLSNDKTTAIYNCVIIKDAKSLDFDVSFTVDKRIVSIGIIRIDEQKGLELCEFALKSLISDGTDNTYMVDFFGGGRLVSLADATPIFYNENYDTRNAAAIFNDNGLLLMESAHLDTKIYFGVKETNNGKNAILGGGLVHAIPAKAPHIKSIKVIGSPVYTIEMPDLKSEKPSWQACARLWQRGLVAPDRALYNDSLIYKIAVTQGKPIPEEDINEDSDFPTKRLNIVLKFKEVLEIVKKFNNILDGAKQTSYVVGWNYEAMDCGLPHFEETFPACGTAAELREVLEEGRKYNAVMGMHDNFDGTNLYSKFYDESIASIDEWGRIWKNWVFCGGLGVNISIKRYFDSGKLQDKVKKYIELYGIKESSHIDCLTSEILKIDYNPENPFGAQEAMEYHYKLLDEFKKYGVDITSEGVSHPYMGRICHNLWRRTNKDSQLIMNEKYIPLVSFIYHGTMSYAALPLGNKTETITALLDGCLAYWDVDEILPGMIDDIYLLNIPNNFLVSNKITDIRKKNNETTVEYENNNYIKGNLKRLTYEVVVNNRVIAKNFNTFCPGYKKGSWFAYSRDGGIICFKAPEGWSDDTILKATELTINGEGRTLPCEIKNGSFIMDIPKKTPVRVEKV